MPSLASLSFKGASPKRQSPAGNRRPEQDEDGVVIGLVPANVPALVAGGSAQPGKTPRALTEGGVRKVIGSAPAITPRAASNHVVAK